VYTVKQISKLAGVTVRTLHYYDEIDLLKPTKVGKNNYRYYDDGALLRLQQILFYREIGLELTQIKDILDSPDFDILVALRSHRRVLQEKMKRLEKLVSTIDSTMMHIVGEINMSKKQMFEAFSKEQEKEYEREARLTYDPNLVNESYRRWNSYSQAEKDAIFAEGNLIYTSIAAAMEAGKKPIDDEVQKWVERWHNHIRNWYEPTLEILRGLSELYTTDPRFRGNYEKLHMDLPEYLKEAIVEYVDLLETAELEQMLAEDEAKRAEME
jgi:DNA-binding transcriptional MerR regulator